MLRVELRWWELMPGVLRVECLVLTFRRTYKNFDFESFLGWRVRKIEDDIAKLRRKAKASAAAATAE